MLSSNAPPEDLYKEGLQRNKFLPSIHLIQAHFTIFNLEGAEDYRLREISSFNAVDKNVKGFLHQTFEEEWSSSLSFTVNNREFSCKGRSQIFLWLSFEDFFSEPCGSMDFIEIAQTYEWVFLSEFHSCNDEHLDKIRRFISYIDIAYQEKQKMKLFADVALLQNLYMGTQLKFLWERSASRLHEISSKKYLEDLEKK